MSHRHAVLSSFACSSFDDCVRRPQEEYMLTEEGFKIRVAALRKEEEALSRERERLERDKARYCIFRSD